MIIGGSVGGCASRLWAMTLKRSWLTLTTVREVCVRSRTLVEMVLMMVLNLGQIRRVLTKI